MAISFPLSLPEGDGLGFETMSISAEASRGVNQNKRTFQRQIFQFDGYRFRLNISWVKLTEGNQKKVRAFLLSLLYGEGTVLIGDPANKNPQGTVLGTPLTNGSSNAIGNDSVSTKGWTINQTGVLKAGDDIAISNYLYTVLKDASSDGSGNATVEIFPPLRTAPVNGTAITKSNAQGLFRLENYNVGWSVSKDKTYDIQAVFVEAI